MKWALVVSVLFFIGFAVNVSDGNTREAIATFFLGTAMGTVWLVHRIEASRASEFLEWAYNNRGAVEQGVAEFNGARVGLETEVTQFQVCVSALILTTRFASRFLIVGHHSTFGTAALCSGVSLVVGWWGIPWGFIYTPQTVWRNARGGEKQKVRDLLAQMDAAKVEMEKAAAASAGS